MQFSALAGSHQVLEPENLDTWNVAKVTIICQESRGIVSDRRCQLDSVGDF